MAHQRRLAGAGQPHDDEYLPRVNRQRQVVDTHHAACFSQYFVFASTGLYQCKGFFFARAENLEHVAHFNLVDHNITHLLPHAVVGHRLG